MRSTYSSKIFDLKHLTCCVSSIVWIMNWIWFLWDTIAIGICLIVTWPIVKHVDHVWLGKQLILPHVWPLRPTASVSLLALLSSEGVIIVCGLESTSPSNLCRIWNLLFGPSFLNRLSRTIFWGEFFILSFIFLVDLRCVRKIALLALSNFRFYAFLIRVRVPFLQGMRALMLICKVCVPWLAISWTFTSSSLLGLRTLVSVVERFCFLQVMSSCSVGLFVLLNINVIVISVSPRRDCLVWHIKSAKVRGNELSACHVWALFSRYETRMNLRSASKLTRF